MQTLKKSPSDIYDVAIIGAGICGCATSYFLREQGASVALFDRDGIGSGGSGAAGAFVSPKFSKSGLLKQIIEEAYLFSMAFYLKRFPDLIRIRPLMHFAKWLDENDKIEAFKQNTTLPLCRDDSICHDHLRSETKQYARVALEHSGLVEALSVCRHLADLADFYHESIVSLRHESGYWNVGSIQARHVVLATGAYSAPISLPYLSLRAVWGHRIDIRTSTVLPCHMHQFVSIAATDDNGLTAIGATHNVHYHPETSRISYDVMPGREELLNKAARTVELKNVEILADHTGLRSGSNDYLPIIGSLVDSEATLSLQPGLKKGEKLRQETTVFYPNLSMINGVGGYGFVLAPWLAKHLAGSILHNHALPVPLTPQRFLPRWARQT